MLLVLLRPWNARPAKVVSREEQAPGLAGFSWATSQSRIVI
jgi:hypothetical protein